MHDHAPNVWADNRSNPSLAPLQPRFDGGIWNRGWSGKDACGDDAKPPTLPAQCTDTAQGDNLRGIQNTVTNGLYLVLALRLYQATRNRDYLDAATLEYGFLRSWFDLPDNDVSLLNKLSVAGEKDDVLVRERVATYANGDRVCGYESELSWSGDQGIMVGGLIDWLTAVPGDSEAFRNAAGILDGVYVKSEPNGGVLKPWTNGDGGDPDDYSTGVGVFMRYLLYADQNNDKIRSTTRGARYQKLIDANVNSVLNTPIGSDFVALTNSLAILVAAIVISRN
jgi:hypothetical protein